MQHLKMNSLDAVHSAFEAGNSKAKESIERAAHYLGISLANLIGTLNIQKIVLTGDMTRFGAPWLETVHGSMQNAALTRMSEGTQLELGTLDYRACILGASAFLLQDGYSPLFSEEGQ
jgi:glucokinase